jgi:hypothetical protein
MTLKLNSRSSFIVKLNRFEDFSWIWQWWQYLMRYSIAWEFISWSNRSRIACKRRVERWSKRRWRRRNSISMKKQEFWSKDFAISDCAEIFQRRNAWSYRRIIEWCSFFILIWRFEWCSFFITIWRLFVVRKCSIFKLIWRSFINDVFISIWRWRIVLLFWVRDFELIKIWVWNLFIWFELIDRSSISILIRLLK